MALRKTSIAIPFGAGVETKIDPKRVQMDKLLGLENAVFRRDLAATTQNGTNAICKRNGYSALPGPALGMIRALGVRGDELVGFTDDRAYSWAPSLGAWHEVGPVVSATLTDRVIGKTGAEQADPDTTTNGGVRVAIWLQAGSAWWTATDDETGRVLRAPEAIATATACRVVAAGSAILLLWSVASLGVAYCAAIHPGSISAAPVAQLVIDDLAASGSLDVAESSAYDSSPLIAWASTSGNVRVGYLASAGVLGSAYTGHPVAIVVGPGSLAAVDSFGGLVAVARASGATVGVDTHSESLASISSDTATAAGTPVRLTVGVADATAESLVVAWELPGATERDNRIQAAGYLAGAFAAVAEVRGLCLVSSAFTFSGEVYAWCCHAPELATAYLLMRLRDGAVIGRYLPGGAAYGARSGAVLTTGGNSTSLAYAEVFRGGDGGTLFGESGIRVASVDFEDESSHQSGQLGGCLYVGGAQVWQYDGSRIAEAGFHYPPDEIAAVAAAGGSLTASTSYLYHVTYEEVNAMGEVDRGPLSPAVTVALAAGQTKVTLTIPTYRATARRNVRVAVWRSPSNDPAALYRLTPTVPTAPGYLANDPTVDTVTFEDTTADLELLTREPLYTNGGIPSNDPTPGASLVAVGKNRVFTNDPSDPLLVRYSQSLADGFGVEFAPQLAIKVDPAGGPITGLAVLDDVLIVFKRDAVFAVGGPGPLANPDVGGQGFTEAALVTGDAGCSSPDSIADTPVGVAFQSAKGIYLLDRSRQLQYLGASVERYNGQSVRAATLLPDRTQIVFVPSDGKALLFDYHFGQWSTFGNHTGADAVVVDGRYHYLRTDGRVFVETPGEHQDDNSQIRMTIETAWVKLGQGAQGFQRIYHAQFLGRYVSPHTLRVRVQTDYEDGWSGRWDIEVDDTHTEDTYGEGAYGDGPFGGASQVRYQERIHVGKKCQAVRFSIQDIEPTAVFGGAFELSELLITGGVKGPAYKVGSQRTE